MVVGEDASSTTSARCGWSAASHPSHDNATRMGSDAEGRAVHGRFRFPLGCTDEPPESSTFYWPTWFTSSHRVVTPPGAGRDTGERRSAERWPIPASI